MIAIAGDCRVLSRGAGALVAVAVIPAVTIAGSACKREAQGSNVEEPCLTKKLDPEDGRVRMTTRVTYDGDGRAVKESFDFRGDDAPERVVTHTYRDGVLAESAWDEGPDGEPDETTVFRYDGGDKVEEIDFDGSTDDERSSSREFEYDENGRLVERRHYRVSFGDSELEELWRFEYDGDLRVREVRRPGPDADPDFAIENRYDDSGNLVRKNKDSDVDGEPDRFITYEHDGEGRRVKESWYFDASAPDQPDEVYVHEWDCG